MRAPGFYAESSRVTKRSWNEESIYIEKEIQRISECFIGRKEACFLRLYVLEEEDEEMMMKLIRMSWRALACRLRAISQCDNVMVRWWLVLLE